MSRMQRLALISIMLFSFLVLLTGVSTPIMAASQNSSQRMIVAVRPNRSYSRGYRDGYRVGFRDGLNACGLVYVQHARNSFSQSDYDRGYGDGYDTGFNSGLNRCNG